MNMNGVVSHPSNLAGRAHLRSWYTVPPLLIAAPVHDPVLAVAMGNGRSRVRDLRSVHALTMHDEERSEMYQEPLLAKQALQEEPSQDDSELDLKALIRQLNSFFAVLWPVCATMAVASLVVCNLSDDGVKQAMSLYMYYRDIDSSDLSMAEKSEQALCNAMLVITFIALLTFGIVLLYKFNCMKFFLGYCIFYSGVLLGVAGSKLVIVLFCHKLGWIIDSYSLSFVMYNFAVVGVLSVFYQKGIPPIVEKGYLVASSVLVAWQLSQLPQWSVWMILFLLAFWDLFAVMTPMGPLRWLVELVQEKGTPLPGLLFEAEITDSHLAQRSSSTTAAPIVGAPGDANRIPEDEFMRRLIANALSRETPPTQVHEAHARLFAQQVDAFLRDVNSRFQHRATALSRLYLNHQRELWRTCYVYYNVRQIPSDKLYPSIVSVFAVGKTNGQDGMDDDDDDDKSIKLGLGDFIFYSVLVASAASHGFDIFAACFLSIIIGLAITMYLLAKHDALPALPVSIFLGILTFLLAISLIAPFLQTCLHAGILF